MIAKRVGAGGIVVPVLLLTNKLLDIKAHHCISDSWCWCWTTGGAVLGRPWAPGLQRSPGDIVFVCKFRIRDRNLVQQAL